MLVIAKSEAFLPCRPSDLRGFLRQSLGGLRALLLLKFALYDATVFQKIRAQSPALRCAPDGPGLLTAAPRWTRSPPLRRGEQGK